MAPRGAAGGAVDIRRRNWLALALGTVVMTFSYFPYAAAFTTAAGEEPRIDTGLVAVGLVVAPLVFIVTGVVSRNPQFAARVLRAMGLLLLLGLGVGLASPVLGATAGFGVGGALTLREPDVPQVFAWRLGAVAGAVVYTFLLLVVLPPAGVVTGGLLPLLIIGFADEFAAWRAGSGS